MLSQRISNATRVLACQASSPLRSGKGHTVQRVGPARADGLTDSLKRFVHRVAAPVRARIREHEPLPRLDVRHRRCRMQPPHDLPVAQDDPVILAGLTTDHSQFARPHPPSLAAATANLKG